MAAVCACPLERDGLLLVQVMCPLHAHVLARYLLPLTVSGLEERPTLSLLHLHLRLYLVRTVGRFSRFTCCILHLRRRLHKGSRA